VVETSQTLDEHVNTLVAELVPTSGEEIESVVQVEVVVSVEVTANKVIDLLLGLRVQVLELVHGGEFLHIQTIGQHTVGLALEQVLALECGDVRDRGEDIATVGSSSFNAVAMVDTTLSGLGIHIEVLKVVVEIDGPRTEIAT